jgi:integrase
MLVREMLDRYFRDVVPNFKPRTQKDYAWIIGRLNSMPIADMHVDAVKPKDIGFLLDVEKGKQSRNRMVAVLSAAYSKAVGRWFVAEKNPCLSVQRNESKPRTRYVTDEEFKIIYDLVPRPLQIAMELALLTYQRQGDLLTLTWENVQEHGIFFQQGKTGKKLLVKFTPALEEVLDRARKLLPEIPRKYVIRRRNGTPYTSSGFKAIWIRKMREAHKAGLIKEKFTFHDLRAKACTDTGDVARASRSAGHNNIGITQSVYIRGVQEVQALR